MEWHVAKGHLESTFIELEATPAAFQELVSCSCRSDCSKKHCSCKRACAPCIDDYKCKNSYKDNVNSFDESDSESDEEK